MRTFANKEKRRDGRRLWAAVGGVVLTVFLIGCSAAPLPETAAEVPSSRVGVEPPLAVSDASTAVQIHSVEIRQAAAGALVEVDTTGALVWTTYRDSDGNLVVELLDSLPAAELATLEPEGGLVESVTIDVENGERPLTRLVVRTRAEAEHSVVAEGTWLRIELQALDGEWAAAEVEQLAEQLEETLEEQPLEEPVVAVIEPASEADATYATESYAAVTEALGETSGEPAGVPATQLQDVQVATGEEGTVVRVLGDGEFYYSTFALQAPERFVVDLIGVVNAFPQSMIPVGSDPVERVRVAQFKPQPELVTRVVVDLIAPARVEVERRPDGLTLHFGSMQTTTLVEDLSASFAPQVGEPAAAEETAELSRSVEEPPYEDPPYEEAALGAEPGVEGMGALENGAVGANDLSAVASAAQIEPEPAAPTSAVGLYAEATAIPGPSSRQGTSRIFETQRIGEVSRTYQGEPMTMSLKDADIKDVLRSFAQISGLNVVVQPGVSGTVTVELANVPWDQALEQILKINDLDYQLEGNIMRVAPISKLREEAEERQRLRAAQALSIPLTTIMKRVSYADAPELARLLSGGGGASIMSQRGSVVVDRRTSTLIIKELPSFMDSVIAVIENLDIPEPQVMIEARIIETTRRFSRSLGIQWGFMGVADAAHGNTTGLEFPNNATVDGGVSLLTGGANGFLDISLGNVLNTFRLDALLQAAESDGLINVLSAPRITTLNNQEASIQSGLQIPIQTVANNTVSVQFVNATLRLDVTPHVTAEGTVMMDINIQKREPQLAFAVVGATNAPIATRDARTKVIVRDGGTTVIGGIYEVSTDEGEDRVPGLANVPILKHLFKNKRRTDENEELLIFITPRVVKL